MSILLTSWIQASKGWAHGRIMLVINLPLCLIWQLNEIISNWCTYYSGFLPKDIVSRNQYEDFGGRHLNATEPLNAQVFVKLYVYHDGRTLRTGADHEALKYLASAMNFKFSIVGNDDVWGKLVDEQRNRFNGMIGRVQRKEQYKLSYTWRLKIVLSFAPPPSKFTFQRVTVSFHR